MQKLHRIIIDSAAQNHRNAVHIMTYLFCVLFIIMPFTCRSIVFIPLGTVQYRYLFKAFLSLVMIYTAPYLKVLCQVIYIEVFIQEHNGFYQYGIYKHIIIISFYFSLDGESC